MSPRAIETTADARVALTTRPLDAVVACHGTRAITIAELLADAGALSRRLSGQGALINGCANRYAFLVGFVAALMRGCTCLLPGDRSPPRLALLRRAFPDSQLLADDEGAADPAAVRVTMLTGAPLRDDPLRGPPADHIALVGFTSGSTGEPVGHARRWGSLMRQIEAIARRFQLQGPEATGIAATVPHGHMYGFETTILLPLRAAVAVHTGTPLYPSDVRRTLAELPEPRVLVTSPVHLRALVASEPALPPVRGVISATAPLSRELAARVETRLATTVLEIYGCTEAGSVASRSTLADPAWTPFDGVRVVPSDDASGAAFVQMPGEPQPIALNDEVTVEPDGGFHLLGRRGDMIKVAGKRASLAALSATLTGIDGVEDGVIVMPETAEGDEAARPCALVVAPGLSARTVLEALRRRIDAAFVPRRVILVEVLPRDALGKLPRAQVAALLEASREPTASTTIEFPIDHPALPGHFPGRPILPGVVLLDAIARAARAAFDLGRLEIVPRAKFLRPVGGGEALALELRRTAPGRVIYEARQDGELIAAGELAFAAGDVP